ncbi:MAG TPA: hypothetical protein VHM16_04745 [Rubrobacteraceae bacterium]|nr:hypothetical protein [Rubrobacteraceae bacterium]
MPPDRDLDRELQDLGPHVEYPPTPDLARSVRERLEAENAGADAPARTGPQLWWIAAAALVLLVAVPVFATVANNLGGAFSGGAAGRAAESGQQGAADVAKPSVAMESGASAEAACASPEPVLQARPARAAAGDEFQIRGRYFIAGFSTCDDTGSASPAAAQTIPASDVRVEFLQDGRAWDLGRLASDENSRLIAKLQVPVDATPGRATVRATYGQGSADARFFVTE